MEFHHFQQRLQAHIKGMLDSLPLQGRLFVVNLDKDRLWGLYLESFPEGSNTVIRKRREHDCSACRHFVKSFGNVVSIVEGKITTVWDFNGAEEYQPSCTAMASYVLTSAQVKGALDVFVTKETGFGIEKNREQGEDGGVITWEHMHCTLPPAFVYKGAESTASVAGSYRDIRNVFKRSLDEITPDSVDSVLELISSNSLYKGEEWGSVLDQIKTYQATYSKLPSDAARSLYCWEKSVSVGPVVGKIRNHSIGTLLTDISAGVDLDEAVRKYEAMVAPSNYKRPKAIYSQKMLDEAAGKLESLGLMDSLPRRYAILSDITVNNTLFANRDVAVGMKGNGAGSAVFASLSSSVGVNPKNFGKVEEVPISSFVKNVLPTVRSMEVLLENRHGGNLVSLIAPQNAGAPSLFKWDNGFSWAYAGNMADSMKQRVKAAGGNVEGVLRFSLQWNEEGDNDNDFDAHCLEPGGYAIFWQNRGRMSTCGGMLDVDVREPKRELGNAAAVENIAYADASRMAEGEYLFFVYNYSHNGGRSGFAAEIEFDGQIHTFAYNKELKQSEKVPVAKVNYSKAAGFSLTSLLPSVTASRKLWGLDTQQFVPVTIALYSPNYWDEGLLMEDMTKHKGAEELQHGTGNRHYLFMLKNCINPENPNGFFNEYLKESLLVHKHVFEALGARMRVADCADQLSGLGFSSTKRDSVVVRTEGSVKRVLRVVF